MAGTSPAMTKTMDIATLTVILSTLTKFVMPGLVPGIRVLALQEEKRGWPGQARP
jgi:hypothetical protein